MFRLAIAIVHTPKNYPNDEKNQLGNKSEIIGQLSFCEFKVLKEEALNMRTTVFSQVRQNENKYLNGLTSLFFQMVHPLLDVLKKLNEDNIAFQESLGMEL